MVATATKQAPWIGAEAAAGLLGVSRATLYAYVSRGRIRSQAVAGRMRERQYARDDVERLRRRADERKHPDHVAARSLDWGLPVLESAIALIDGQRLYYRGYDAVALARERTFEEVASLVWTGQFGRIAERPRESVASARSRRLPPQATLPFIGRAQSALAAAAAGDPAAFDTRPAAVVRCGDRILRVLVQAATLEPAAGRTPDAALARAWRLASPAADLLRRVLVLCADHELNVSSFTARCAASAGASPYGAVIAALAALEGPKHGGASARAEAMLHELRRERSLRQALAGRLQRGESIDGFGHPLYPDGDPRATAIFDWLRAWSPRADLRFVGDVARVATTVTGEHPNLDFALAAVARVLRLPAGAPLMLFAIGRTVGWIGHAIEQYASGQLIRPRAKYVGVTPGRA
ncbi:MAG: citrate synthase family protein [Vicinamibacterales bacterium]